TAAANSYADGATTVAGIVLNCSYGSLRYCATWSRLPIVGRIHIRRGIVVYRNRRLAKNTKFQIAVFCPFDFISPLYKLTSSCIFSWQIFGYFWFRSILEYYFSTINIACEAIYPDIGLRSRILFYIIENKVKFISVFREYSHSSLAVGEKGSK